MQEAYRVLHMHLAWLARASIMNIVTVWSQELPAGDVDGAPWRNLSSHTLP